MIVLALGRWEGDGGQKGDRWSHPVNPACNTAEYSSAHTHTHTQRDDGVTAAKECGVLEQHKKKTSKNLHGGNAQQQHGHFWQTDEVHEETKMKAVPVTF
ncbi:hypothetical protein JOB18_038183 [Solea senegalensis]|uniref:Uncharacterized protein n=1 Tax=Solea senegalensis TaxID=28829 RepID=A0AAV6S311_SOLSE|nr:hypothetical protein JOB18_038183 [Solea senegalensis]